MNFKPMKALLAAGALATGSQAWAIGVAAGTQIDNIATVNYSVGGVAQNAIGSSANGNTAGAGTATSFLVDRRLDVNVVFQDANQTVSATPGQQDTVLTFQVTNESNSAQDILLAAIHRATGTVGEGNGTDSFNSANTQVFVETNGQAGYQAGADTAVFIDELAADASIIVYVISDIPLAQVNGDASKISVVAQLAQAGTAGAQGAAITSDTNGNTSPGGTFSNGNTTVNAGGANTTADAANAVQDVFADAAGDVNGQGGAGAASNGQHADTETLQVVTAALTVRKTSVVIDDPVNGTTNPKAIPGATVEYCVIIANAGLTDATAVTITDAIPTNTDYVTGTVFNNVTLVGGTAGTVTGTCNSASGTAQTDAADAADATTASEAAGVTTTYTTVGPNSKVATRFRVTVN